MSSGAKRLAREASITASPRSTKKAKYTEAGEEPNPEFIVQPAFGCLPVTDAKLLKALNRVVNGSPVHAYVNAQAIKLFEEVKVCRSLRHALK